MQIVGTTSLATFLNISLINLTFVPHVSLTVYFIANAIFLSLQCSSSNTLFLFLSLCCLALFPSSSVWYKNPGNHFHAIIDYNKLFWLTLLFHLEADQNISDLVVQGPLTLMLQCSLTLSFPLAKILAKSTHVHTLVALANVAGAFICANAIKYVNFSVAIFALG